MIIRDRIKELRRVPARDLIPNPKNWRVHPDSQRAALQGVLDEIGYADAVLAREDSDGKLILIDGHLRAETTPNQDIPVLIVDLTEEEADLLLAVHDPMAAMAYPNLDLYLPLVEHLEPESQAVSALLEAVANNEARPLYDLSEPKSEGLTDPDDVPEIGEGEPTVKAGQVWALGDHRLMCGDATSAEDVERLMDGERAALVVTSPPYGIGKSYESGGLAEWESLIQGVLATWSPIVPCAAINLADVKVGPEHREIHTYGRLVEMCERSGWPLIGTRIWAKPPAWSQGPYWLSSYRAVDDWEFIGLFGNVEYHDRVTDDWCYRGVWEIASVVRNKEHSAGFPVELPSRLMKLLCVTGAIVADPFLGSGTTLIACEKLGRTCYAMEIEPRYCDVTIKRWEDYTGRKAALL